MPFKLFFCFLKGIPRPKVSHGNHHGSKTKRSQDHQPHYVHSTINLTPYRGPYLDEDTINATYQANRNNLMASLSGVEESSFTNDIYRHVPLQHLRSSETKTEKERKGRHNVGRDMGSRQPISREPTWIKQQGNVGRNPTQSILKRTEEHKNFSRRHSQSPNRRPTTPHNPKQDMVIQEMETRQKYGDHSPRRHDYGYTPERQGQDNRHSGRRRDSKYNNSGFDSTSQYSSRRFANLPRPVPERANNDFDAAHRRAPQRDRGSRQYNKRRERPVARSHYPVPSRHGLYAYDGLTDLRL